MFEDWSDGVKEPSDLYPTDEKNYSWRIVDFAGEGSDPATVATLCGGDTLPEEARVRLLKGKI